MKLAIPLCVLFLGCASTEPLSNLAPESPTVWRSGQPNTPQEWQAIKSRGIKTILKLNFDAEGSDAAAEAVGLKVERLPIPPSDFGQVLERPDEATIAKVVSAMSEGNVLVHCTHGEDRTGLVVAIYRVTHDGWTKERAAQEMNAHHFHSSMVGLMDFWEDFKPKVAGGPIGAKPFDLERPLVSLDPTPWENATQSSL